MESATDKFPALGRQLRGGDRAREGPAYDNVDVPGLDGRRAHVDLATPMLPA